jgi:hypothetical protein
VELVLAYYDKTYGYGLAERHAVTVAAAGADALENAKLVLAAITEMPVSVTPALSSDDANTAGSAPH